jgi:molybdopterin synthase catalytic subunit|tara:strand:+ start:261 stop:665 length:405 start_codon:yes stop_codon:yes gene_type:complete
MIKIQNNDFNLEEEINSIKLKHSNVGAISTFIGYVRDSNNNKNVTSINLEVYEEMALKTLKAICESAKKKWSLIDFLVIHRFGELEVNEKIVLVATLSLHRKESFLSCNYIMDFLKKDAPFWKKEFYNKNYKWL